MSTVSKKLKDTNGNVILPKTRSEQVYRPNNTTVESALSNLSGSLQNLSTSTIRRPNQNTLEDTLTDHDSTLNDHTSSISSLTKKTNTMSTQLNTFDVSGMYYNCACTKSGTVFTLTSIKNIPSTGTNNILHFTFSAPVDFVEGDTFNIKDISYTPKLSTLEPVPSGIFKSGALVSIDINTSTKLCFFKLGGGGSEESTPPNPNSYQLNELITTTRNWSPPQSGWFRIFCVGKSGDGGKGGNGGSGSSRYESIGHPGGGGGGGGSGGVGIYELYVKNTDTIPITISSSITSFGDFVSATAGNIGNTGGVGSYNSVGVGSTGGTGGEASGGNIANLSGYTGGTGSDGWNGTPRQGTNGGNDGGAVGDGTLYGNDQWGYGGYCVSGGGGARYSTFDPSFAKYVMSITELRAGGYCGGKVNSNGVFDNKNNDNLQLITGSYFNYDLTHLQLTGGGMGGAAGGRADQYSSGVSGRAGKPGCPGCIIIEKSTK